MDQGDMLRAALPAFLSKNREQVDALVQLLNKVQKLSSLSVEACTGQEYPVHELLTDRVIGAISRNGGEVVVQILEAIDAQMNDAFDAFEQAYNAAAAAQPDAVEEAPAEDPPAEDPPAEDPPAEDPPAETAPLTADDLRVDADEEPAA